MYQNVTK